MEIDVSREAVEGIADSLDQMQGFSFIIDDAPLPQDILDCLSTAEKQLRTLLADNEALRARAEANAKDAERLVALREYIAEERHRLSFEISTGCLCLSCYSFFIRDFDGKVILENEDFRSLVDAAIAQAQEVRT